MYSQYGEDDLVKRILESRSFDAKGIYIDVGCNHPSFGNNTFALYKSGWRGICIDAHESFAAGYAQDRPEDIFLACAIGPATGTARFHFDPSWIELSSLRRSDFNSQVKDVAIRPLSSVIEEYAVEKIDLLSVDVEGAEIEAIASIGEYISLPRIIVAEYNTGGKINLMLQPFLISAGFHIVAVTQGNFVATREFNVDCRAITKPH